MSDTLDLFSYPISPGAKVGGTSLEAADSMKPTASTLRASCFAELRFAAGYDNAGYTADEVAALLGESVLSCRPRFSELHALGLIRDTGERRLNASGRRAIVWEVASRDDARRTAGALNRGRHP